MGLRDNGRGNAHGTGFGKFGFWWPQSCFPTVLLHIMWNKSSILVINLNFISIQTLFRPYLHPEGASNQISGGQTGIKSLLCSGGKSITHSSGKHENISLLSLLLSFVPTATPSSRILRGPLSFASGTTE